jgi:hypothetical protein
MGADGKVLARLRGPVTAIDASPPFSAGAPLAERAAPEASTESKLAQVVPTTRPEATSYADDPLEEAGSDDLDEIFDPDDFVDMRPASMRPDVTTGSDAEERFW